MSWLGARDALGGQKCLLGELGEPESVSVGPASGGSLRAVCQDDLFIAFVFLLFKIILFAAGLWL